MCFSLGSWNLAGLAMFLPKLQHHHLLGAVLGVRGLPLTVAAHQHFTLLVSHSWLLDCLESESPPLTSPHPVSRLVISAILSSCPSCPHPSHVHLLGPLPWPVHQILICPGPPLPRTATSLWSRGGNSVPVTRIWTWAPKYKIYARTINTFWSLLRLIVDFTLKCSQRNVYLIL